MLIYHLERLKRLGAIRSQILQNLMVISIQLSPEGEMNSGMVMNIYRGAKRRVIYLALFTDPEGDSCVSI